MGSAIVFSKIMFRFRVQCEVSAELRRWFPEPESESLRTGADGARSSETQAMQRRRAKRVRNLLSSVPRAVHE